MESCLISIDYRKLQGSQRWVSITRGRHERRTLSPSVVIDHTFCHETFALLLLPNLFVFPFLAFIFFNEKPLISPVEKASPLLENRFFPPKPNFSSFFCLLLGGFA